MTDTTLRIALVQLAVEDGAPERNVARAESLVGAAPAADLYLLPELWTTGYAHASWPEAADQHTPATAVALQRVSDERRAWVAGSMISRRGDGRLVNRLWLFGPGRAPVCYDKAHLFSPMHEPTHLAGGTRRVRSEIAGVPTALSICFDLRFPGMYRRDALDGAALFLVASAWPHPRSDTLRLLARARAAENQAYLVLCNRAGRGADGTVFCGGSAVIAPDGEVIAEGGEDAGVVTAEVSGATVAALRSRFPVLSLGVPEVDGR
jgi:predicted amidohydrolase